MLATLVPDCVIFKKSYVAPPRVAPIKDESKVALPHDFMKDLPVPKRRTKQKRLKMISKGKDEIKVKSLNRRIEAYKKDLHKYSNKISADRHRTLNRTGAQ